MPLTMLTEGSRARVTAIYGSRELNHRLAAMGLLPGVALVLVRGGPGGPVIVDVAGSRLALGRGMAHRIIVKLI